VWHVSVSAWSGAHGERRSRAPQLVEREAVKLLRGVGGDVEWWLHNDKAVGLPVGHLRVPLTLEEVAVLPAGCALHDAGESGPERPRTR
jgi:hypothetical protein